MSKTHSKHDWLYCLEFARRIVGLIDSHDIDNTKFLYDQIMLGEHSDHKQFKKIIF